jgi:hypothetical protein
VAAEKVRFEPKGFRWRTPDPQRPTVWRWGLHGVIVGLYRAPELVEQRKVLLVEGEHAAKLLAVRGLASTCPPAGASAWSARWSEALWRAGAREIIVLPDADGPGRLHGVRVASACCGYRPSLEEPPSQDDPWPAVRLQPDDAEAAPLIVRVVELPGLRHGEDVVDWLASGHTIADLLTVIDATPQWSPEGATQARVKRCRELARERKRRQRARERLDLRNPICGFVERTPGSPREVDRRVAG